MKPDAQKEAQSNDRDAHKTKKEPRAFLGVINYLHKFSPSKAEICEAFR